MESITREVFEALRDISKRNTQPIDLITKGVEILQPKAINKEFKREILIAVLERIAYGNDGIANTADDRLSPESLELLIILLNSDVMNSVITGIVATIKKTNVKKCFKWPLW
jgi:hypothetical protein